VNSETNKGWIQVQIRFINDMNLKNKRYKVTDTRKLQEQINKSNRLGRKRFDREPVMAVVTPVFIA